MTSEQEVEVLCQCLAATIPAAKAYGMFLKGKIVNVEEKAQLFTTLVQVCSHTDQTLTRNEMVFEGTICVKWIISKLRQWDKTITIKQVCDSMTLLEGKPEEDQPFIKINYKNKYYRVLQPSI
jgi:hypothetical protein